MALLCWPVAGLAGRFSDRPAVLGTAFAAVMGVRHRLREHS